MNLQILEPSQVLAIENQLQLNYLMDPKQGKESSERPLKQTLSKKEQETGEQFVTSSTLSSILAENTEKVLNALERLQQKIESTKTQLSAKINTSEMRLQAKIHASEQLLSEKINTSEMRLQAKIHASEQRLQAKINTSEMRLQAKINACEIRLREKIQLTEIHLLEQIEATKQRLKEKIKKLQGKLGVVYNQLCQKLVKALEFIQQLLADLEKTQQRLTSTFDENLKNIQQKITICQRNLQYLIREVPQSDRNFVGELNQAKKDIQELRSQVDVLKSKLTIDKTGAQIEE